MAHQRKSQRPDGVTNGHAHAGELSIDLSSEKVDRSRWRLEVGKDSRHVWHYLKTDQQVKDWPQSTSDKYFLGLPTVSTCPQTTRHLRSIQLLRSSVLTCDLLY